MAIIPDMTLQRDLAKAAVTMGPREARFLVDTYYLFQESRKRAANQIMQMQATAEPCAAIRDVLAEMERLEDMMRKALDTYSAAQALGQWARRQKGIGPVIAAGLLAHIDLARVRTAGQVWRFAGLDPTVKWAKGEKRPWNAQLKTLCWKMGESFVKVSGNANAFYGRLYLERKAFELLRNGEGYNRDVALERAKTIGKNTEAYKSYSQGLLPLGHLHARAKRYAVKLFLGHYFEVGKRLAGETPPAPWVIAHGEHAHYIPPPD